MALVGVALPPAQFSLTVTFGSEEVIPVERLFKAFGMENLAINPNQVLLPLKLPKDLPREPTIEQFWQYRSGWESLFDEEYDYRIYLMSGNTATRRFQVGSSRFRAQVVSWASIWSSNQSLWWT